MPEAALFITWGQPVRGRERRANDQLRWVLRVSLVADRVGVFDATVDPDRLARTMDLYDETVAGLD